MVKNIITDRYQIMATLQENENVSTFISGLDKNLFIVNRIKNWGNNEWAFQDFYSLFNSKKMVDMQDFFADKDYFYIIFKYKDEMSIKDVFIKNMYPSDAQYRFKIVYDTLIKINSIVDAPISLVASASSLDNICIDKDNQISLKYMLSEEHFSDGIDTAIIYKNIAKLIGLVLHIEFSDKYNKDIKIIIEKCTHNLYSCIPELIKELEAAEHNVNSEDIQSIAKRAALRNKKKVYAISGSLVASLFIIATIGILANNGNVFIAGADKVDKIGDIYYTSGSTTEDGDIDVSDDIPRKSEYELKVESLVIDPDYVIDYEDYVVKPTDTLDKIVAEVYGTPQLIKMVRSFNRVTTDELPAGTIIKMPDSDAIASLLE